MLKQFSMEIKLIKSDEDYRNALKRLETIFDAPIYSMEGDEAEILSLLIENYENKHYPIEAPDPVEAIKIRMEEMNLKQKDLVGILGGKSAVSEILNKKKKLTLEMIRALEVKLNISASLLIKNYQLK
jgi:HTH-type transcriptional regulator/antitoxin HigA